MSFCSNCVNPTLSPVSISTYVRITVQCTCWISIHSLQLIIAHLSIAVVVYFNRLNSPQHEVAYVYFIRIKPIRCKVLGRRFKLSTSKPSTDWLAVVKECRASGLSDKDWCREHGIPSSTFYYHIRRLRKLACEIPTHECSSRICPPQEVIPLVVADDTVPSITPLVQHERHDIPTSLSLHIECGNISITCPDGLSSSMICSVIQALRMEC